VLSSTRCFVRWNALSSTRWSRNCGTALSPDMHLCLRRLFCHRSELSTASLRPDWHFQEKSIHRGSAQTLMEGRAPRAFVHIAAWLGVAELRPPLCEVRATSSLAILNCLDSFPLPMRKTKLPPGACLPRLPINIRNRNNVKENTDRSHTPFSFGSRN
jgi:hypothetical protein